MTVTNSKPIEPVQPRSEFRVVVSHDDGDALLMPVDDGATAGDMADEAAEQFGYNSCSLFNLRTIADGRIFKRYMPLEAMPYGPYILDVISFEL